MINRMKIGATLGISLMIISCAPSLKQIKVKADLHLSSVNKIIIKLYNLDGNILTSTATRDQLGGYELKEWEIKAISALDTLQNKLQIIGFKFVANEIEADAIVDFRITFLEDEVGLWWGKQAETIFKDSKTGEMLASYQAESGKVASSIRTLLKMLTDAIRKAY